MKIFMCQGYVSSRVARSNSLKESIPDSTIDLPQQSLDSGNDHLVFEYSKGKQKMVWGRLYYQEVVNVAFLNLIVIYEF